MGVVEVNPMSCEANEFEELDGPVKGFEDVDNP
jgi:hypothetical protein